MKILIWLAMIAVCRMITTLLRMNGIFLGIIPIILLYGSGYAVAYYLCKKLPGMWQCANCEQLNKNSKSTCACGHTKEWTMQQPGRSESWKCAGCGRTHDAATAKCFCGYSKEWSLKQTAHK